MRFVPIIIIQTSSFSKRVCCTELLEANLRLDDYFVTGSPKKAEKRVAPQLEQLLVTGAFDGNEKEAGEFAVRMKRKNPKLVAARFSAENGFSAPYDMLISKIGPNGKICSNLIPEMRKFLSERRQRR